MSYLNNFQTTLAQAALSTDTTIYLNDVTGLDVGDYLTFADNNEIIQVTAVDTTALTVTCTRGLNIAATDHALGTAVQMRIVAEHLSDLKSEIDTHIADVSNPHGVTAAQVGAITAVADDTAPALGGALNAGAHTIYFTEQAATATIDWSLSNKASITLTADTTLVFTDPANACNLVLKVVQDTVGGHLLTFPTTVKWVNATAPTLTTTASAIDIIEMYFSGGVYYAVALTNFG